MFKYKNTKETQILFMGIPIFYDNIANDTGQRSLIH